jgi:hypothetical protein
MPGSSPGMTVGLSFDSIFKQRDRHCERSEAIHLAAERKEDGLLRFARNDGSNSKRSFAISRRARAVHLSPPQRGRGECRMPNAPAVSCAIVVVERTRVTTSTPESPGIPARNGFTAYVVLSSATGLFCHRRLADMVLSKPGWANKTSARLDASIGASGPHDFAVRNNISRQRAVDRSQVASTRPAIPSRA